MQNFLPMFFIVLGALALIVTLFWLWQSLRDAVVLGDGGAGLAMSGAGSSSERAKLLDEKQSLLLALTDLGAERDAGKLSDEDFAELNARYRARAKEVLQALDAQLAPHRAEARRLIAQALGAPGGGRESSQARKSAKPGDAKSADAQAQGSVPPPATQAQSCASCNTQNESDAVFCKKCGAKLAPGASS